MFYTLHRKDSHSPCKTISLRVLCEPRTCSFPPVCMYIPFAIALSEFSHAFFSITALHCNFAFLRRAPVDICLLFSPSFLFLFFRPLYLVCSRVGIVVLFEGSCPRKVGSKTSCLFAFIRGYLSQPFHAERRPGIRVFMFLEASNGKG